MNIVKEDLLALSTLLKLVSNKARWPGEHKAGQSISEIADVYNAIFQASKLENKLKAIVDAPPKPAPRRKPVKKVTKNVETR